MKIACITLSAPSTGIGKTAFQVFHQLSKIEKNVDMFYFQTKESTFYNKINIIPPFFGASPTFHKFNMLAGRLSIPLKLPRGYDIYHFFDPLLPFDWVHKPFHPMVMTLHDLMLLKFPHKNIEDIIFKLYAESYKCADKIITVSQNTKNDAVGLIDIPQNRIEVVYNGVEHSIFNRKNKIVARRKLRLPLNKKIILHVGEEYSTKNITGLLRIFQKVKEKLPNTILIRIGEQRIESYEMIEKDKIKDVFYFSKVDEDKLALFYNAADILLFPSLYEGFGLPPLEAMACGCPVIASNTSSIPEVVGNAGILVNPSDENKFAYHVIKVLSEKDIANKFSEKGMQRARLFGWDKTAKQLLKIYKEIIRK